VNHALDNAYSIIAWANFRVEFINGIGQQLPKTGAAFYSCI